MAGFAGLMSAWLVAALTYVLAMIGELMMGAYRFFQQVFMAFLGRLRVKAPEPSCREILGLDSREDYQMKPTRSMQQACREPLLLIPQKMNNTAPTPVSTPSGSTAATPRYDSPTPRSQEQRAEKHTDGDGAPKKFVTALHCDENFNICGADASVLELLKYERDELIGKSIMELMSPAVADVHKQIFRNLKHIAPESVCAVGKQLLMSTMSRCREFAVLDKNKEAVVCSVSVVLRRDLSSKVILQSVQGKILYTVPLGFGSFINDKPGCHVQDFDDVMCVMMDLAGSTRFSQSKPPSVMAELFHRMYVIANAVVLQEAFPFAYIHEIVGDSLLLVVNAGFMVRYPSRAAAIGSHVAMQIQRRLDVMLAAYSPEMYTRVGIAVGPVSAGVVDGRTFRIFGSTVHLSQRLESLCPRGKVACSMDFLDKLCRQIDEDISVDLVESEIKGFGTVKYANLKCGVFGDKAHAKLVQ